MNAKALELEKGIREKNCGVSANNRCLFREDFSVQVASSGCPEIQALIAGATIPRSLLPIQKPPLQQITSVLHRRAELRHPVNTLHVLAHGRPGAFRFGDQWIDAESLKAHANELASWGVDTIALWSCHVRADANFVALLEELTGAQVLASGSWLGRENPNERLELGDWRLSDLVDEMAWPDQFRLEGLDDELIGSDTADELSGGEGDDSLTGGAGRDDFELSDGDDLILDFEDDIDVISVSNFKDLSLEQDGDDVLISRGDEQTLVLNTRVDAVADSLVRIAARLENNPLTNAQQDDLRAAFRRLLAGKAVDADAIGDELSKDQKKGVLRSLRSAMNRDPLVSDDALSQITGEQKEALIMELKRLLNGREISKDPLGNVFSKEEKQVLKEQLSNIFVGAGQAEKISAETLIWFSDNPTYKSTVEGEGSKNYGDSVQINLFHPCYSNPGSCLLMGYPDRSFEPWDVYLDEKGNPVPVWSVGNINPSDPRFDIGKFQVTSGKPALSLYRDWDQYFKGSDGETIEFRGNISDFKSVLNQNTLFSDVTFNCEVGGCVDLKKANPDGVEIEFRNWEANGGNSRTFYITMNNPASVKPGIDGREIEITHIDGMGICAADEFLFEVQGNPNGVVSFDLELVDVLRESSDARFLPLDCPISYSESGDGNWEDYKPGYLTELTNEGKGYLRVKLEQQPEKKGS